MKSLWRLVGVILVSVSLSTQAQDVEHRVLWIEGTNAHPMNGDNGGLDVLTTMLKQGWLVVNFYPIASNRSGQTNAAPSAGYPYPGGYIVLSKKKASNSAQ